MQLHKCFLSGGRLQTWLHHCRSRKPIELSDWQIFLFANILGFKYRDTGLRKYRSAYVQVARKNAKSTIGAILANWLLVMEKGQQDIYTASVSRDQARIVFDDAKKMATLSKPLNKCSY